jgi:hypothetical protein
MQDSSGVMTGLSCAAAKATGSTKIQPRTHREHIAFLDGADFIAKVSF